MTIWTPGLNRREAGPLYIALAHAIESDVLSGRLHPGDQLPTHRELADRLKVTVGTVSRAYAEARKAGWISGEVGRGTFVLDRNAGRFPARPDGTEKVVDLSLNIPIDKPAPDLAAALKTLSASESVQSLLKYASTDPRGDQAAGAIVLERHGLSVDPGRVVLCAGTQHGIGAALETVTRPGDTILVEELTYPAFRPLAEARGLRIGPVALDAEGISPAALHTACRKLHPRALYVLPTIHNPTTGTLSAERRAEIAKVARRHDLTIIEDDLYRLLAPDSPPPIATLAPERTVYVTSLSKSFVPGLRLGYMVGPPELSKRLNDSVYNSLWMLPPITVALATQWIRQGEFDRIVTAKRREAAARVALARKILPREHVRTAEASYHLWLSTSTHADAFALAARNHGVLLTPGSAFHMGSGPPPDAVRISLSAAADRSILAAALQKLRSLLDGSGTRVSAQL